MRFEFAVVAPNVFGGDIEHERFAKIFETETLRIAGLDLLSIVVPGWRWIWSEKSILWNFLLKTKKKNFFHFY